MPLYEYKCLDCKNSFTELIRLNKIDTAIVCPECRSKETKRVFSLFSVGGNASVDSLVSSSKTRFT